MDISQSLELLKLSCECEEGLSFKCVMCMIAEPIKEVAKEVKVAKDIADVANRRHNIHIQAL